MADPVKPMCRFGSKCYRKNPQHLKEYRHQVEDSPKKVNLRTNPRGALSLVTTHVLLCTCMCTSDHYHFEFHNILNLNLHLHAMHQTSFRIQLNQRTWSVLTSSHYLFFIEWMKTIFVFPPSGGIHTMSQTYLLCLIKNNFYYPGVIYRHSHCHSISAKPPPADCGAAAFSCFGWEFKACWCNMQLTKRFSPGNCSLIISLRFGTCLVPHINLCAIEYSLVDAPTALKHGDEACLHIWHLTWNLYIVSPNLSCKFLTDKMNLLIKCFSAIWFLTIWTTWENSDFAWKNLLKFII